jgi:site-specific recombinase XerD
VGLDECALLSAEDFVLEDGSLRVSGKASRKIDLPPAARKLFSEHAPVPLWADAQSPATGVAELAGRIPLLASDAGVAHPQEVTADALRHGYLGFLVRQGARLTEIERIVGSMPAGQLKAYAALAPAGPAKGLDAVDRVYPALR